MKPANMAWLSASERYAYIVDLYRILPRVVLISYGYMVAKVAQWFMTLPAPSPEQAAFVTLVCGFFVPLTNWYMQNGVDWEKRRLSAGSVTTTTQETIVQTDTAPAVPVAPLGTATAPLNVLVKRGAKKKSG